MADRTEIAWCDSTFNPWIGCTKVGQGCDNCYAEADFGQRKKRAVWGAGEPRSRTSVANWKNPVQWNAKPFYECDCGWRGDDIKSHSAACNFPSVGRIHPARRRVFCASLADVFDNEVPAAWRMDLFSLIAHTPNLDWLLLTKRIGNVMKMCQHDGLMFDQISNIWLGASICNKTETDRDIHKLLAIPARVRFVSMEPLLGAVNLRQIPVDCGGMLDSLRGIDTALQCHYVGKLDWVVVGGESGPHARPMNPEWARSLRDQCAAAGVPFMFKQHGEYTSVVPASYEKEPDLWMTVDGRIGNEEEALKGGTWKGMHRVGKKAAGRMLDGKLHDGYPEVRNA